MLTAPKQVHKFVPGNRMYPRCQWLMYVIGVALVMHGKQRFLNKVLDFR